MLERIYNQDSQEYEDTCCDQYDSRVEAESIVLTKCSCEDSSRTFGYISIDFHEYGKAQSPEDDEKRYREIYGHIRLKANETVREEREAGITER